MLKDFSPRIYQQAIFNTCANWNTLVVLPTGMGKTAIAIMLAAKRLLDFPKSKVLMLAPTKPLVEQHKKTFLKHLEVNENDLSVFTGNVKPETRAELWKKSRIIFSTPQGLENDIISGRIGLEDVSLLIFDEAHRCVGDYAYGFIAKQYLKKAYFPRILGLTASPGSDIEKIKEVCSNLSIEKIEIRSAYDNDVRPYIMDIELEWINVDFPKEFEEIRKYLNNCFLSKLKDIEKHGYLNKTSGIGKKELLKLQGQLHSEISHGNKDYNLLVSISRLAEAIKVQHGLELLETQGITPLYLYLQKLIEESAKTKTKALKNLVSDSNFKSTCLLVKKFYENGIEHPKMEKLKEIIENEIKENDKKIIIFTQFRDSATKIKQELDKIDGVNARIFVGQAKKKETGMSQKEQKRLIDEFSNGEFNVMIATSVAEEGLDIPKVDVVVFYEPIPSAIRHIQRRGRTGRLEKGRVIILITKKTRDEGHRWSAFHKEKRMHKILRELKSKMLLLELEKKKEGMEEKIKNSDLRDFIKENGIRIFADDREKGNGVIKELVDLGVNVELKRLEVGDYIVSSRCAIEYKRVPDFVDSLIDGRLLQQLKELKTSYERPIVIVEGHEDIYSIRKVHPNAIRGALATIAVSYSIPILHTKTLRESAALIAVIAKREQEESSNNFSLHAKKPLTLKEQQEYIVSALPGIGLSLAKPLLIEFGTIKNIVNASEEELKKIEKIGEKKAKEIQKVLNEKYNEAYKSLD
ncbi:MAG: DEAD/DEAH box helicase [Candidatus Woesearchaeota archaeon]|nr:DEAD/DEAH box helicase [Candidatus Woesearchaeota archaeon]